jgi:DNA primase
MYYPEHIITRVREETDIIGIISEYTSLTKKGSNYVGLCPFHQEKTPSFSVSDEKQMYYCFGCGAGGNVITFMMEKENMAFPEVIEYLAEKAHIEIEVNNLNQDQIDQNAKRQELLEIHTKAARFFYTSLMEDEGKPVRDYLEKRGVSKNIIKRFGIGYASPNYNILYRYLKNQGHNDEILLESGLILKSKQGKLYDRFSDRLMFPIFNLTKKVIAFGGRVLDDSLPKYLNSPESMLFDKSSNLYGLHLAREQKHTYYILVEGYMDVMAMHQAGFSQTVASLGTAFTTRHAKLLKRYTKEVVILYDSDTAGKNAVLRAIPILRAEGILVRVLQLQQGKDPDEYLKKHSADEMQAQLDGAKSDTWFKIENTQNKYQLAKPDDKVKFLQEAATFIGELTSSIEQNIYTQEIASKYNIDEGALQTEIRKSQTKEIGKPTYAKPSKKPTTLLKGEMGSQVDFLAVVYHYPEVFSHIKPYVETTFFQDGVLREIAKELFTSLEKGMPLDVNGFNGKYETVEEQAIISRVFMNKDERYTQQETIQKMLTETIKRLNKHYIEKELKQTNDLTKVQELLKRKKQMDGLYIAFING